MTVADLVDRYMNLKRGLKPNSLRSYNTAVKRIHADPFGQKAIKTVKLSDAKGWFVFLHDSGFKQNTIGILQSVIRPAFEMAVEDPNMVPPMLSSPVREFSSNGIISLSSKPRNPLRIP